MNNNDNNYPNHNHQDDNNNDPNHNHNHQDDNNNDNKKQPKGNRATAIQRQGAPIQRSHHRAGSHTVAEQLLHSSTAWSSPAPPLVPPAGPRTVAEQQLHSSAAWSSAASASNARSPPR